MADISDYPEAVKRIMEADVDSTSTTRGEVAQDLAAADGPQVTLEVANNLANAVVTTDKVIESIEESGDMPESAQEIADAAALLDDHGLTDRIDEVSDDVERQVVTREEVRSAVRERAESSGDRPVFREEVETAVEEAAGQREIIGSTEDEVVSEQAFDVGAPRETDFQREAAQTVAQAEQVTPSDVVEGTEAQTPVQIIEDTSGNPVAATGGPSEDIGRQVADEVGAEYLSTEEVTDSLSTRGTGDSVDLTLAGSTVGEVDVV